MKKVVVGILIGIFLCVAAVSGYQVYTILSSYHQGTSSYEALEEFIVLPETLTGTPSAGETDADAVQAEPQEETEGGTGIQWPQVDFASLAEINAQVVGWIYLPDTQINYPVALGEDNAYYLTHLFDGGTNSSGAIFLDCRNQGDFSNSHSILYGHHMKNGSMFAGLVKYKDQDYYDQHPTAYLMTPTGNYTVELFSGYVASEDMDSWQVSFDSEADFSAWLEETKSRSLFLSEVTPQVGDRILTLSTCSYEFENARFVVVGVLRAAR